VSHKGYFQQRFYAFLVMIAYPTIQRVTLREFYVRFNEVREATLERGELDDVRAELSALVERYDRAFATKTFPPSPGHHCGYCLKPQKCPIPVTLRREGRISSDEEAAIVARQLVVGNSVAKQSRQALAAWADTHGPVPIKDAKGPRVYGYTASEQTRRPDRETLERALASGEVDVDRLYKTVLTSRFVEHVPRKDRATDEDVVMLAALEGALAEAHARKGSGDDG
jgi:hypothetical protein